MPLSTEPRTFGEAHDILDMERRSQIRLFEKQTNKVKKSKPISYRKELRELLMTLRPEYRRHYNYLNPYMKSKMPSLDDPHFRYWVRTTVAYKEFRKRMIGQGVKIPGPQKESVQ